ncbi:MAG TPA: mucoidy inhibitor MuiA family protein [Dinghuibacter sp.]|uniref:DUF4139 domain-containing protein n=1 Tax=Dinghuibacter sp. TaxID=2024697 RepID=UPI002BCC5299|nr:mucoidy inhibitor MuiA family protein [Dinghuibacter sp.]HTJ13535.1 mucoidy inhibitor MuiA family protein [Dinghuibacter sp.]
MKKMIGGVLLLCMLHAGARAGRHAGVWAGARAGNPTEPLSASAVLQSVMVYRSGAELTHSLNVMLPAGNVELGVDKVSTNIDQNTVQLHLPDAVTLLGFSYVDDYLSTRPRTARQQQLEDSLARLQEEQDKVQLAIGNNETLMEVLKKNQEIRGTQTGMNVADLQKLMDYYGTEFSDLSAKNYALKKRFDKLAAGIEQVKSQIASEDNARVTASGRLVLHLSVKAAGTYDFNLSYITRQAGWAPTYELQVGDARDSAIRVVYKANISQTTGLDWKQVKLSLSTSVPGSWSEAPGMNPWFIGLRQPAPALDEVAVSPGLSVEDTFKKLPGVQVDASGNVLAQGEPVRRIRVNGKGFFGGEPTRNHLPDYVVLDQQRLNLVYNIDLPYDLPSTGKQQLATLQEMKVKAHFTYLAAPKVSDDVYLLADIPDWGRLNLLPGQANIILDGTYQGVTGIDPASIDDTLHLTIGRDKRITLQRKKITDFNSDKFLNANRYQKYVYEISARNNKNEPVQLSLLDQFPVSTNKDVEVTLNDPGNALVDADRGELRWALTIKAGESSKVRFGYTVRYPKGENVQY